MSRVTLSYEQYEKFFLGKGIRFKQIEKYNLHSNAIFEAPCQIMNDPKGILRCGAYTIIRRGARLTRTKFGRFCAIGPDVTFGAPEHRTDQLGMSSVFNTNYVWTRGFREFPLKKGTVFYRTTEVGNDVWIGNGAFIKAGISIGNGAVIAARAVVTKDVPPYAIVGGNPAKLIRFRFSEEIVQRLLQIQWWNYDPVFLSKVDLSDVEGCLEYLEQERESLAVFQPMVVTASDVLPSAGKAPDEIR